MAHVNGLDNHLCYKQRYECAQAYSKQSNSGDEDDREDDVEHSLNHHSYGKKSVASKGEENITEGLCAIPNPTPITNAARHG